MDQIVSSPGNSTGMQGNGLKLSANPESKLPDSDVELPGPSLATFPAVIQKHLGLKLFLRSASAALLVFFSNESLPYG